MDLISLSLFYMFEKEKAINCMLKYLEYSFQVIDFKHLVEEPLQYLFRIQIVEKQV